MVSFGTNQQTTKAKSNVTAESLGQLGVRVRGVGEGCGVRYGTVNG
jgi:hypothetical protein